MQQVKQVVCSSAAALMLGVFSTTFAVDGAFAASAGVSLSSGAQATNEASAASASARSFSPATLDLSDLPSTALSDLVKTLVENEEFIAALINNEAFIDRLAGDDSIVSELERRKASAAVAEARQELATELVRRQQILDELKTRGPDAVVALADETKAVIDGVEVVPTEGKDTLVQLETAMELLEDSEELMMAMKGKSMDAAVEFSGEAKFKQMEGSVAYTEYLLDEKMAEQAVGRSPKTIENERKLQAAVKELFNTSDVVAEEALVAQKKDPKAAKEFPVTELVEESAPAVSDVVEDKKVLNAFDRAVLAVADVQRSYNMAISKAAASVESKVTALQVAAKQGVGKAQAVVEEKKAEVEKTAQEAKAVVDTTVGTVTAVVDETVGTAKAVVDTTVGTVTSAVDTTVGKVTAAVDTTVGAVTTTVETAKAVVDTTTTAVTSTVETAKAIVEDTTKKVVETKEQVEQTAAVVAGTVTRVAETVDSTIKSVPPRERRVALNFAIVPAILLLGVVVWQVLPKPEKAKTMSGRASANGRAGSGASGTAVKKVAAKANK